ncbi:glycosyltransferase [Terriglobus sp.]|uniref:glycosyltransferase n=1 Tax=Terriglobus sp. TaxID=1889013 RepID=UPI003B000B59
MGQQNLPHGTPELKIRKLRLSQKLREDTRPDTMNGPWQILDVGSIWMREFACAMAQETEVVAWWPVMRSMGALEHWERVERHGSPELQVLRFPLQRGYARPPLQQLFPYHQKLLRRLQTRCPGTASPLVCTTPFYAPVAERWPGPVVYYVTDMTAEYVGLNRRQVVQLDRRMCQAATAVCPNSGRIRDYLLREAACSPAKLTVVPNATRQENIAAAPLLAPGERPKLIRHVERPIAGVIGNLSGNMDWLLLEDAIRQTPWLHWVMVGPTDMPIPDACQAEARARIMRDPCVTFTGAKPYGELQAYARCFNVAVLPYRKKEPTYSGSSTRFYEHLAACRPMVATRGFAELLEKPPLLELVDTPGEMVAAIDQLRDTDFHDGHEAERWQASRHATWTDRARSLMHALEQRL